LTENLKAGKNPLFHTYLIFKEHALKPTYDFN